MTSKMDRPSSVVGLLMVLSIILWVDVTRQVAANYDGLDVADKSPSNIIEYRGYKAETHIVRTSDGYHINVVRIVHPIIKGSQLKRPIVFNHGLLESSTFFLMNSHGVVPQDFSGRCEDPYELGSIPRNQSETINLAFLLANHGYDVWLMSMRGTDYSLGHDNINHYDEQFWDYSLDDFALVDVPTVCNYVSLKTYSTKVGYVGHSQATFSVFALLATRPDYADLIEPVVALTPVAYFSGQTSLARILFDLADKTPYNGPHPPATKQMREAQVKMCSKRPRKKPGVICNIVFTLISGKGDKHMPPGFFSVIPYFTSLKVLRHFSQLTKNSRFAMYDYGEEKNLKIYGQPKSPDYPIEKIRSESLCLISTKNDVLSVPSDVDKFRARLKVKPFRDIVIEEDLNHFDVTLDERAAKLINEPVLEIFEIFNHKTGTCKVGFMESEATDIPDINELDSK